MRYFNSKNLLKISLISVLLIMCVGSIYAADADVSSINIHDSIQISSSNDFDLDDDEFGDDSDFDLDEDFDFDWVTGDYKILYKDYIIGGATAKSGGHYNSDYNISDYEYLEFKILSYLDNFGNSPDENWTTTDDFLAEYQLYLENPSSYTFNESDENYETYLKIYDSIVSKFGDYNLTQNETDYLKFLAIYYLNHYGNCSNCTWDECKEFYNYYMTKFLATSCPNEVLSGFASSNEGNANTNFEESNFISPVYAGDVAYNVLSDSINTNSTQLNNSTVTVNMDSNGGENNFIMLLFAVLMMLILII